MAEQRMFQEALDAIKQGERLRARDLLTRLLRTDSSKVEYWLWMSTVVDTRNEKIYCLESALKADPGNQTALRGLIILGARKTDPPAKPAPIIRRKWSDDVEKSLEQPKSIWQSIWQSPILRWIGLLCLSVIVISLLVLGILGIRKGNEALFIRVTPFPTSTSNVTPSPKVTRTLVVRSPTPTYIGPTPLWMFLTQTYTPVPVYINTPHPVVEAYRIALRAYGRGDYNQMLDFIQQAKQADPNAVDLYYYLGEAYRLLGKYDEAVKAYADGLKINPAFGPAYLGRARAMLGQNPGANVTADLEKAIQADPDLADAYLELATYFIKIKDPTSALLNLMEAERIFPQSPILYVLRGQAYLLTGDNASALVNAQQAFELDKTYLPAYITLARALLVNDQPSEAAYYAEIYLRYEPQDADGWIMVGRSRLLNKAYQQAVEALDKAIFLNDEAWEAYYYRGKAQLALGQAQLAVNDLVVAVQRTTSNFQYTFDLAEALWKAKRYTDAFRTFNSAEQLAGDDDERAAVYYYRAQVAEEAGNLLEAKDDWARLLALPEAVTPEEWREYAQQRWDSLHPPTATVTSTTTKVPTLTSTPTVTPSFTPTSQSMATPTPTR
mgnify:CR=1 FL=1